MRVLLLSLLRVVQPLGIFPLQDNTHILKLQRTLSLLKPPQNFNALLQS